MSETFDVTGKQRADGLARASEMLRSGRLVVVPTDTVYGIAADAFDADATGRIFAAKDRSRAFPLPILIRSQKQLPALTSRADETLDRLVAAFWPGPLTIVLPAQAGLRWDIGRNDGTVAVRMPLDPVTLELIRTVGPLAVTSANLSGHPPAQDVASARAQLGDRIEVYLDAGRREGGVPSTIVDITRREPKVLREGVLPATQVLAIARGEVDPFAVGQEPSPDAEADAGEGDAAADGPVTPTVTAAPQDAELADRLAAVRGLGPVKRDRLVATFGSATGVAQATVEELTAVEGVGPALARAIADGLR